MSYFLSLSSINYSSTIHGMMPATHSHATSSPITLRASTKSMRRSPNPATSMHPTSWALHRSTTTVPSWARWSRSRRRPWTGQHRASTIWCCIDQGPNDLDNDINLLKNSTSDMIHLLQDLDLDGYDPSSLGLGSRQWQWTRCRQWLSFSSITKISKTITKKPVSCQLEWEG